MQLLAADIYRMVTSTSENVIMWHMWMCASHFKGHLLLPLGLQHLCIQACLQQLFATVFDPWPDLI